MVEIIRESKSKGEAFRTRMTILIALLALISGYILILMYLTKMPGESYTGPFQALSQPEEKIKIALQEYVTQLATHIGPRNVQRPHALQQAAQYIKERLKGYGYIPSVQEYVVDNVPSENIIAEIKGQKYPDKIIVIGAHYDTVINSPGANDNGTGVAALLALAQSFKQRTVDRTLRFVFFVNEEPPFFYSSKMGSVVYAKSLKKNNENVVAMISLETMGYYSDDINSQKYPFPFGFIYPNKGNFIAFVGNIPSKGLVERTLKVFRSSVQFPSEGGAIPGWVPGVSWSDHWAFWKQGYPAIMITDTAPFRYPFYHTVEDTPDKIHYERIARVIVGIEEVIDALANEPL
jgi:Zn-dependent M28 family amino/carboxypeptidase